MLQLLTILNSADNSGAKRLKLIHIYGGSHRKRATVGDELLCAVHGADPNGTVKNKEKVRVVIVRTRKEIMRLDGSHICFDDNAGVVIDKNKEPVGTRIFGPIAREIKDLGYTKIASLAAEVW